MDIQQNMKMVCKELYDKLVSAIEAQNTMDPIIAIIKDSEVFVFITPFDTIDQKAIICTQLNAVAALLDADGLAMIAEAWMGAMPQGEVSTKSVAEDPARREIVICMLMDAYGECFTIVGKINRDKLPFVETEGWEKDGVAKFCRFQPWKQRDKAKLN